MVVVKVFSIMVRRTRSLSCSAVRCLKDVRGPSRVFRTRVLVSKLKTVVSITITVTTSLDRVIRGGSRIAFLRLFGSKERVKCSVVKAVVGILLFIFNYKLVPVYLVQVGGSIDLVAVVGLRVPYRLYEFLIRDVKVILTVPVSVLIASIVVGITEVFHERGGTEGIRKREGY